MSEHAIVELYQGEVLGEALFNRMLIDIDDGRERHVIASMLQLETETKARLRQAAAALALPLAEDGAQRLAGEEIGASLASMTWLEKMRRLEAGIGGTYLPRYKEIHATAAPNDKQLSAHMVTHESALLDVVRLELAGDAENSVNSIEAQLHFPLPRPAS